MCDGFIFVLISNIKRIGVIFIVKVYVCFFLKKFYCVCMIIGIIFIIKINIYVVFSKSWIML